MTNLLLFIILFIIIIALIYLKNGDSNVTAILLIPIMFMILHLNKQMGITINKEKEEEIEEMNIGKPEDSEKGKDNLTIPVSKIYDEIDYKGFGTNPLYTSCYKLPSWELNDCNTYGAMSIDEKVSHQAKMRNKENRVIDGWTSKNMDYYKKHFSNELELEEKLRWWGNDEY